MTKQAHFWLFPRNIREEYATWDKTDVGKLLKLTLARANVILCKSLRCVKRPWQKQPVSSCWEVCKAICMFCMVINHLRALRSFAFCALNGTTTEEQHNGHLPYIQNMGWGHYFPILLEKIILCFLAFLNTIQWCHKSPNTIKVKGELSSSRLIQHSHFARHVTPQKATVSG